MTQTVYRPRGTDKKTGRKRWLSTVWYSSRAYALRVVKGAEMFYNDIKIVSAPNQTYDGKQIQDKNIVKNIVRK